MLRRRLQITRTIPFVLLTVGACSPSPEAVNARVAIAAPFWLEDWLTASAGPKRDEEVFTADTGPWKADSPGYLDELYPGWPHIGARVSIVDDILVLNSISDCAIDSTSSGTSGARASVIKSTSDLSVPYSRNTVFSGSFECDVRFLHQPNVDSGDEGSAFIRLYVRTIAKSFHIAYRHASSVGGPWDVPMDGAREAITVSGQFSRNLYDDLVSIYGDEFVRAYESSFMFMREVDFIAVQIATLSQPTTLAGPGADAAAVTCRVERLAFSEPK